MGSDASEESIDSVVSSQQRMRELAVEDVAEEEQQEEAVVEDAVVDAEPYVARMIQVCVDAGKETVDLSDMALNSISDATLQPLHQLIRHSFPDHICPPSEDEFTPLTPSIKLFLSTNKLRTLPTELFHLANITVLSLRNNHLTHLPPAIARLSNLTELNIAGNEIRYLPWELLDLLHCQGGKHRSIILRPNPLVEPTDLSGPSPLPRPNFTAAEREDLSRFADTRHTVEKLRQKYRAEGCLNLRGELELRLKLGRMLQIQYLQEMSRAGRELQLCREELIYLASSAVRYFSVDGTPMRRAGGHPSNTEDWSATLSPTAHAPVSSGSSHVPSLFEHALRKLQTHYDLSDFFPNPIPKPLTALDATLSPTLRTAIRTAASNATTLGNETCSTCGERYIIARAEWMEYWFHGFPSQRELSSESVVPVLRRVCCWGCVRVTEAGSFRS